MTTIAAGRLSETLQTLVDARLDTIDRMLLGRVNRQDRLAIVREVETQIFDLLGSRDSDSLDRDDVLAVLARLDPPEAYLPDEESGVSAVPRRFSAGSMPIRPSRTKPGRLPIVSGVLGIIALMVDLMTGLILLYLLTGPQNSNFMIPIYYGFGGIGLILGVLAVIVASTSRLAGGWAITGLVTGIIAMLGSIMFLLIS